MDNKIVIFTKVQQDDNCSWIGKYDDLVVHKGICPFESVKCHFEGCKEAMERRNVDGHVVECPFRTIACDHCNETIRYGDTDKHLVKCPEIMVKCGCGVELKRCKMIMHVADDCPNTIISCPFE